MSTASRWQDDKKRHKSRKSRRRNSAHSSGSELELGSDEDQLRTYEPTSPAQWSPHHRHSTTSSINGRLYDVGGGNGNNANSASSTTAPRMRPLSPIDRLPPELLIHIFRQLTDVSHFYSCLFVSSTWCQCVVELLWLKPHLSTPASLLSFLTVLKPGFNPNASEVPDGNGEVSFDSREVLVNGQWDIKEKVQRLMRPQIDIAAAVRGVVKEVMVEPLFPYARFVRRLNLAGVTEDVHDAHFMCLVACVRLERLTLNGCIHLTDTSLSTVIAQMHQLVALDLTGVVDVTDATIQVVAKTSKRLQGINLEGCKKITDLGIFAIAENCPLLRRIKLCDLDLVTGKSVSVLVLNCPLLIEIDLNSCVRVGEGAARDIWSSCFHLRELRLAQCTLIGDSAFPVPPKVAPSGNNPNNQATADQNMSRVIMPVLPPLLLSRPLVHLRQLDLMALQITDDAVAGIIVNAPKLRNLVLAKCSLLTDKAVRSISGLGRHLQFLHLGHAVAITDASIVHLARTCVRLRYVDLACCTSLTNESVRALSALPKLRRIGLVRVMNLTDQAVEHLTARHNTLERVHLSYCEQITVKAIHLLLQRLDKLTHLSLTGVPAFKKRDLQRFCRHPPSNFNELQRAAFCVYSGTGIHNLRKYLESIAPNLHEYGLAHPENDDDGANGVHGMPSFGDPQLSDTDDEGDDRDLSSHFLLPQALQAATSTSTAVAPSFVATPVANQANSQTNGTTPLETRSQSHSLHFISRSPASSGTSRQASRTQRNGSSSGAGGGGSSRRALPQVPEAYAGMGSSSSSQAGRGISVDDGSVTGIRHRNTNMGGSLSNPVVGALMHSRLQRSVAREEQRSQARAGMGVTNAVAATATGSDGRRGFHRWMAGTNGISGMVNGHGGRSSATSSNVDNGSVAPELVEISTPAVTPSSSTSASAEFRGWYTVAGAELSAAVDSTHGNGDEQPEANAFKPRGLEDEVVTEEASAASCVHHDNASGRSTPVRNPEGGGGGGEGTSRRTRREKEREKASTPQPSVAVALALDDLASQDPSRTSTPSPSPSSHGVRRKLKGFNAAAASLFKGKERKP